MNKDYKAKHKQIRGYAGKDEIKPPLFQEFECKTIPIYKPVKEPLLTLAPLALALPAPVSFTFAPPTSALAG